MDLEKLREQSGSEQCKRPGPGSAGAAAKSTALITRCRSLSMLAMRGRATHCAHGCDPAWLDCALSSAKEHTNDPVDRDLGVGSRCPRCPHLQLPRKEWPMDAA